MLNWNARPVGTGRLHARPAAGRPQESPLLYTFSMIVGPCLALTFVLAFLFFPRSASAHTAAVLSSGPTFQVNAGFNGRYRDGNWVPFQIMFSNSGADFSGTLAIEDPVPYNGPGNGSISSMYKEPISLANGAQKQLTAYIPINLGRQGAEQITVKLLDSNGNVVRAQTSPITALGTNDAFVGILSDQNTGFNPLYSVALPNQGGSMIVETLNASTMPDAAVVLNNFDLIVLDNFTTSSLNSSQLIALQTWVNQGGALIEVGGPEWRRTLSALPASLIPVTINGTGTLPAGTQLLPVAGPQKTGAGQSLIPVSVNSPVTVSTATYSQADNGTMQSTIVLAANQTPLIVQKRLGHGIICYLAFDPTLNPVVNWVGANALWKGLVQRTLGDKLLNTTNGYASTNTFQTSGLGGLLQNLLTNAFPSPWLLAILVLGYLVILGPVRFLIIRWRKRRDWNWRIVLSSIIIFSLLTYGLAIQQKGASILSNSVSIIQLNNGGSSCLQSIAVTSLSPLSDGQQRCTNAHITTYVGVFLLNQGDYSVFIPGNGLVQPMVDQNNQDPSSNSGTLDTIAPGQNGTEVSLPGVSFSTTRSLLSDRDSQIQGGIDSQLTLQNGVLSGTVINTLNYGLSDVYVLMANSFARIGHLAAGQSEQVNLRINNTSNTPGMTLADELAASNGFTTPYGANSFDTPPQNELQRHMAILAALSGESGYSGNCGGGSCKVVSAPGGSTYYLNGNAGQGIVDGSDPLLVAGSPATLIGWADIPAGTTNSVAVNSATPAGLQETLVQSPLNMHFSGTLNLPTNFISGQLIDVQGANVQYQYGGAYTMTTGSMTFEFPVHFGTKQQVSSLRFSEPTNLSQIMSPSTGPNSGPVVEANRLQVRLYDWQTGSWDAIAVNGFTFATSNTSAYIGSNGRVIIQLSNQDSTVGTILFGRPSLDLQGAVS
jgi:hypothetical protein